MSGEPPELPQLRIWYYEKNGQHNGPVTQGRIAELAEIGEIEAETLVWKEGLPDWVPARRLRFLPFTPPGGSTSSGDDSGMRLIAPVGVSGWAIASGYLGLVSVLILPAPFAILTGVMAIRDIRKNPKNHGMGRAIFGIIMGALFSIPTLILVVSLVFALVTGQPIR